MTPHENVDTGLEDLRDKRCQALGSYSPCCAAPGCTETDPLALTGADPNILCQEHRADQQGLAWTQKHHPAGQANRPETVPAPGNDHAVLSGMQSMWPRDTLRNPDQSPLLRVAAAIRGWLDILRLVMDRTVTWIPAALETLDALLRDHMGERWWEQLEWMP